MGVLSVVLLVAALLVDELRSMSGLSILFPASATVGMSMGYQFYFDEVDSHTDLRWEEYSRGLDSGVDSDTDTGNDMGGVLKGQVTAGWIWLISCILSILVGTYGLYTTYRNASRFGVYIGAGCLSFVAVIGVHIDGPCGCLDGWFKLGISVFMAYAAGLLYWIAAYCIYSDAAPEQACQAETKEMEMASAQAVPYDKGDGLEEPVVNDEQAIEEEKVEVEQ